jgi:hypothetical protein
LTWKFVSADSATVVSDMLISLPKPVYIHCSTGEYATFFAQLHLVRVGALKASLLFERSLLLGYDFQSSGAAVQLFNLFTGMSVEVTPEQIERTSYFWNHRIDRTWHSQGQPLSTHVKAIALAGYQSVVSFRANGEATTRIPSDSPTGPVLNFEFSDVTGAYDLAAEKTGTCLYSGCVLAWVCASVRVVPATAPDTLDT